MTTDLLKSLEHLKGIWMMGGSATEKAPPAWREAVQQDPYPDLALLALSGQAIQYALQPVAGGKLRSAQQLRGCACQHHRMQRASNCGISTGLAS